MGPLNVPAPLSGSGEYWQSVSMWDEPQVSSADVAGMLGLNADAVRQALLRRDTTGFPAPAVGGKRHKWTPTQIYDYARERRPQQRTRIPTLFPDLTGRLAHPAVFVAAEHWQPGPTPVLPNPAEWSMVVQYWRPSDGRDIQIAVVYPAAAGYEMGRAAAVEVATRYARQVFDSPDTTTQAVAVVTDDLRPTPNGGQQGAVILVESASRMYPPACACRAYRTPVAARIANNGDAAMSVYEVGWFDLGALLRADLPWWPPVLRSAELMTRWRPGQPPAEVAPADGQYRQSELHALATAAIDRGSSSAPILKDAVERANRRIEDLLCDLRLPGMNSPRPGIVQAAVPVFSRAEVPDPLAATELAWLLRQPSLGNATAADLLRRLPETRPVMLETRWLPADARGDLAQEWVNRLEPADGWTVAHEFVRTHGRMGVPANGWATPDRATLTPLIDPFNQASWAVRTATGDIHYTVGTRSLAATGRLVEAEINQSQEETVTFFRDSAGIAWPLPYAASGNWSNAGLTHALYALRKHADADIEHPRGDQRAIPRLARALSGPPPWRLSRQNVADFLDV